MILILLICVIGIFIINFFIKQKQRVDFGNDKLQHYEEYFLHFVPTGMVFTRYKKSDIIDTIRISNNPNEKNNLDDIFNFIKKNWNGYNSLIKRKRYCNLSYEELRDEVIQRSIPYYYLRDLLYLGYDKDLTAYCNNLAISSSDLFGFVFNDEYQMDRAVKRLKTMGLL